MDLKNRENAARKKIKLLYGTLEGGEFGPTLFISHHLEELSVEYWVDVCGTETPRPQEILYSLKLVNSWSLEDDGTINVLDFSLPNDVTNYVLAARFENCEIAEISMES